MKFHLHIDCDNAAFEGNVIEEIDNCLQRAVQSLRKSITEGKIRDTNGNSAGGFKLERE